MSNERKYCTFILHGWAEPVGAEQRTWRFRLHDVQNGTAHGFTRIEAVVIFLKAELDLEDAPDHHPPPSPM